MKRFTLQQPSCRWGVAKFFNREVAAKLAGIGSAPCLCNSEKRAAGKAQRGQWPTPAQPSRRCKRRIPLAARLRAKNSAKTPAVVALMTDATAAAFSRRRKGPASFSQPKLLQRLEEGH